MPDYVNLAAVAKRLIEEAGRNVVFRRINRAITDAAKPWRASETAHSSPETEVTVKMVFVDPVSGSKMGFSFANQDLVAQASAIGLVAATSASQALEAFDEIVEVGVIHRILQAEVLKPGTVKLLYIFLVKTSARVTV
jgi:hypothetical protein